METTKGTIVTTDEVASLFMKTIEYKEFYEDFPDKHILLTLDFTSLAINEEDAFINFEITAHLYPLEQGEHVPHLCEIREFGIYTYHFKELKLIH